MLAVVLVSVLFNFSTLNSALSNFAEDYARETLLKGRDSVDRFYIERHSVLRIQNQTMASSAALRATLGIEGVDIPTVMFALNALPKTDIIDLVILFRPDMRVWIGPDGSEDTVSDLEAKAVRLLEKNEPESGQGFIWLDHLYLVNITPVMTRGIVFGYLLVGDRQDDSSTLGTLKLSSGTNINVINGNDLVGSTHTDDADLLIETWLTDLQNSSNLRTSHEVVRVDISDQSFLVTQIPMDDTNVSLVLDRMAGLLPESVAYTQQLILGFAIILVVMGLMASLLVSRIISAPVTQLTEATKKYQAFGTD